jgi:hypothetical protein
MLRLKRQSSDKVSIVWRERTSPSKRLVAKAFAFSFLLHFIMVIVFQIRIYYEAAPANQPMPAVFLDSDESSIAVLTDIRNNDEDPRYRLAREMHLSGSCNAIDFSPLHQSYAQSLPSILSSTHQKHEFLSIITLPWSFSDELSPSHHICRVYPLKISLHQNLRSLQLIDDGARLFRKSSFETLFCTPAFSETQPRVEFKVEVNPGSGAIIKSACLRELTDKRLQGVAQRLVKNLRFKPTKDPSQKTPSGILTLQFAGTFDMINPLLEPEQAQ